MFVGGIGIVAPAPPIPVVRYVPTVIGTVVPKMFEVCHHPPFGGAAAESEKA
jgi:hypothetical protein